MFLIIQWQKKNLSATYFIIKLQVLRWPSIFFKTLFILMPIVDLRLPLSSTLQGVKHINIMTKYSDRNPEGCRRGARRTGGAKRAF